MKVLNSIHDALYQIVKFGDNMTMAMALKPAPKLAVISVYRMKIH